jgi:hypothetical protein
MYYYALALLYLGSEPLVQRVSPRPLLASHARCPQAQIQWLGSKNQWTLLLHFVIEARPLCKRHPRRPLRPSRHPSPISAVRSRISTLLRTSVQTTHLANTHPIRSTVKLKTTPHPAAYPLAVMRLQRGIVRVPGIRARMFHHAALQLVVADVQPPQVFLVRPRRLASHMRLCVRHSTSTNLQQPATFHAFAG